MARYIVDIHCHTFNALDVASGPFLHRTFGLDEKTARWIELHIASSAPGYSADRAALDRLLGPDAAMIDDDAWLREHAEELADLRSGRAGDRLADEILDGLSHEGVVTAERRSTIIGLGTLLVLLLEGRLHLTSLLSNWFDERIDLFVPICVDLLHGLKQEPPVPVSDQLALHELISRVSMLGRLPGARSTRVHPFVGFDPSRPESLKLVTTAIEQQGFVGVKLYPPMGFFPTDPRLNDLFEYCVANDVPITTHTTVANRIDNSGTWADPANWVKVLEQHSTLRLNLGHFGGAEDDSESRRWRDNALALVKSASCVYADLSNHRIVDDEVLKEEIAFLERAMNDHVAKRIMYSSDWHFVTMFGRSRKFLDLYRDAFRKQFKEDRTDLFMGANALSFLGFDEPDNGNNVRLRKRYEAVVGSPPSWLAAVPSP